MRLLCHVMLGVFWDDFSWILLFYLGSGEYVVTFLSRREKGVEFMGVLC